MINFTCQDVIDEKVAINHDHDLQHQSHINKGIKLRGGGLPQSDVSDNIETADIKKNENMGEMKNSSADYTYEETDLLYHIPQFDGSDGSYSNDKLEKTIFSINCEITEIVHLINFLRSSNIMWILQTSHQLCSLNEACFFCSTRSS